MMNVTRDEHIDFGSLKKLRDEIRLRVHLAELDMKDKWSELENQLDNVEHRMTSEGGTLIGATAQLARDLKQSLLEFRQRLSPT